MVASASTAAQTAPWEKVPEKDQFFVLITGANSGVGLGIAQRLIDDFLASRSLSSHLILLPTTRDERKARETIRSLRAYAAAAARNPTSALRSRAGGGEHGYDWRETRARIHVLCLTLDLCDLRGLRGVAEALCRGTVGNPEGSGGGGVGDEEDEEEEYLTRVRVPRLDCVIYNAAFGGWSGVDWLGAAKMFFTKGLLEMATYPTFKKAMPTCILNERREYNYPDKPLLGQVFTACTFGHYFLTHQLLPLLLRSSSPDSDLEPARIIWSSSLEAHAAALDLDDMQCLAGRPVAYESAKRLTDVLVLTCALPSVQPYAAPFFRLSHSRSHSSSNEEEEKTTTTTTNNTTIIPPRMLLSHPGIVASTLFPLPPGIFWLYALVLALCRLLLGSPWHVGTAYRAARAPVWLALSAAADIDTLSDQPVKWGSALHRHDASSDGFVKETEVEGWGWRGPGDPDLDHHPDRDTTPGPLNRRVGRRSGARNPSREQLLDFEDLGARCWQEMERLRLEWEAIIEE